MNDAPPNTETAATKGTEAEFKDIRDRYKKAVEYWSEDRKNALDDLKFSAGEQWPQALKSEREKNNRPCLTVDKLNQYVRQIVNDGRQNRPSIKVRPVDGGADSGTAKVLQGIIRNIEDNSSADTAYDTALESVARCGQGYFRVLTEYTGEEQLEQDVVIQRIRNPLSVTIDPMALKADSSDMKFCFIEEVLTKDEFKKQYPKASLVEWEAEKASYEDWFGETIRVCEYFWIEETPRKVHMLSDGSQIPDKLYKELTETGMFPAELTVTSTQEVPKRVVNWAKMSGSEWLEKPQVWPGRWIPILVVYGNELDIEGKVCHSGLIRAGKDPQRLYNYSRSAFAERVALTPKAPWVAAEGQIEDYEAEWASANVENRSVLKYRPTALGGSPVPPPQRLNASDIPQGFAQDMQLSDQDIQAALGMYNASLGAPSNERSGKAILARNKEGDTGTYHYHDNLNRAIRHCGRILVDLIPKVYDTPRVLRIIGEDDKPGEVKINPQLEGSVLRDGVGTVYNLGVGKYDVSISSGPSYTTLRQEAAASMTEMVQAQPEMLTIVGDLMVKAMDWPGADEIADRLKLMLPPEIKAYEEAKKAETASPEMQLMQQQFETALQQKDQLIDMASNKLEELYLEIQKLKANTEAAIITARAKESALGIDAAKVGVQVAEAEIKAYEAETQRAQMLAPAMSPEQIQAMVVQTLQGILDDAGMLGQSAPVEYPAPQQPQLETPAMDSLSDGVPMQQEMPPQQPEQMPQQPGPEQQPMQ